MTEVDEWYGDDEKCRIDVVDFEDLKNLGHANL